MRHLLAPLVGALALAWAQCAWAVDTVIELPAGTVSWTVPSDWTSTNKIICIGAGAGGSGGTSTGGGAAGGGGGAGAYGEIDNIPADGTHLPTPGNSVTVGVGTHGSGGGTTGTSFGTAGGDTYFNASSLAVAVTNGVTKSCGGSGGKATTASGITGGVGGTTLLSTGTTKFAGGAGGTVALGNGPAGGGAAAGSTGTGGAGGAGGAGGSGPSGSGGGAINAGTAGGVGGSGVTAGSGGTVTGGSGGAGGAFPSGTPTSATGGNGGGGGGGTFSTSPGNGGAGSAPSTWTTNPGGVNFGPGSGGGSGGANDAAAGTCATSGAGGGLGGGGAGGANCNNDATFAAGGNGGDGGIIIIYTPSAGGGATPTSPMLHGIDYQTQSHLLDDLVYHPSGKPITPVWFPHGLASGGGACPFTTSLADGCAGAQANGTTPLPHLADTQKAVAANTTWGTGYTLGTGYTWTSSGGGCSITPAGTVDVVHVASVTLVSGGSGFSNTLDPGGSITFANGATVNMPTISGGAVTSLVMSTQPSATTGGTLTMTGTTSGTGSGVTASFTYSGGLANAVVTTQGSGCTSRPAVTVSGSAGAGSGGSIVLSVYQKTPHNAATTFSLPGVDYGVGYDTTLVLKDPTVGGNLPGCATVSGSQVTVNSGPCTLNGFDFIAHSAFLTIASNISSLVTISNSRFYTPSAQGGGIHINSGSCNVALTNNEFTSPVAALGAISPNAYDGELESQCSSGTIVVEYNYCHDVWAKCWDYIGVPGSVQNLAVTEKYNVCLNSTLNPAGDIHGECEYTFSGTTNEHITLDCEFNVDGNVHAKMLQYLAPQAAPTACGEADDVTLVSPNVSHNVLFTPGPWAATGSDNSSNNIITASADIFAGHQEGGVISPSGTMTDNYMDYTGSWFPYNATGGTLAGDFPGLAGVNMVTGTTTCTTSSCN